MSIENNEAIIATTWNKDCIEKAKAWIANRHEEQQNLFVFVPALANGKTTIFLAPDAINKGLDIANDTTRLRDNFITFLESFNYEDGSSPFDYVEVGYGDFGQKVLRGNCRNRYGDNDEYQFNAMVDKGTEACKDIPYNWLKELCAPLFIKRSTCVPSIGEIVRISPNNIDLANPWHKKQYKVVNVSWLYQDLDDLYDQIKVELEFIGER